MEFLPGQTWVTFSDLVMHGAMGGRYMLEQTLYLPVEAQHDPAKSPQKILERKLGRALQLVTSRQVRYRRTGRSAEPLALMDITLSGRPFGPRRLRPGWQDRNPFWRSPSVRLSGSDSSLTPTPNRSAQRLSPAAMRSPWKTGGSHGNR